VTQKVRLPSAWLSQQAINEGFFNTLLVHRYFGRWEVSWLMIASARWMQRFFLVILSHRHCLLTTYPLFVFIKGLHPGKVDHVPSRAKKEKEMIKLKNRSKAMAPVLLTLLWLLPATALAGSDDISAHPHCPICGMDRNTFAHSRMLIQFEDGSQFGSCSLHCAALELAYHPGKVPTRIKVADYNTRQLVDAETAVWVIGGSKMGVMTANAKWAFGHGKNARQFIAQYGGEIADFETAMSAAYSDMYRDTRMIREKRKKMKHKK
jgi:hypothetical protein